MGYRLKVLKVRVLGACQRRTKRKGARNVPFPYRER
jgi:hypothetical protein